MPLTLRGRCSSSQIRSSKPIWFEQSFDLVRASTSRPIWFEQRAKISGVAQKQAQISGTAQKTRFDAIFDPHPIFFSRFGSSKASIWFEHTSRNAKRALPTRGASRCPRVVDALPSR
jgi:hypothetical protein